MRQILIIITVLVSLACVAGAAGTTFTFQPSIGVWNDPANWNPLGGPPGTGDTAILGDKRCTIESGTTEAAKIVTLQLGGTLVIEDDARLDLGDSSTPTTTTLDGAVRFVKTGTPCSCDPLNPPAPGTIHIVNDVTIMDDVVFHAGCDDDAFTDCRNSGNFTAPAGKILTLEAATSQGMEFNEYIQFDVELDIDVTKPVKFTVKEVDQMMKFNQPVTGPADILLNGGTLEVNDCLLMQGLFGGIDFGVFTGDPEHPPKVVINAFTCQEDRFGFFGGTLEANADFRARGAFHLGPEVPSPEGEGAEVPETIIEVAAGVTVSFALDGGSCNTCPP